MKPNEENKRIPNEKALRSVLCRNQSSVAKHCHRIPSYSLINFDEKREPHTIYLNESGPTNIKTECKYANIAFYSVGVFLSYKM